MSEQTPSERVVTETSFLSWIGIEVGEEGDGRSQLYLPHRAELTNRNGDVIHGGVIATLIDNAAGTTLRTVLEDPERDRYATTELNVSYLRPATGDLRAEGEVLRHGGSLVVIQVDVTAERDPGEWRSVAVGRATYYVEPAAE